jgi:protein-L-isoaspartate(D-aspartate) O-methyltransferase
MAVSVLNMALVDALKDNELIYTPYVEAAFRAVPRHLFVPGVPLEEAYSDRSIPIKRLDGQLVSSCSQPSIMAIMLEQLGLEPGHKVLEIGAGTGYNAALMAHIVGETGRVVTVDIDEDIVSGAREHLAVAGFHRVQVVCADGGYGCADAALYDRIILTVGASDIAPAWWEQMKPGGRLVLPLALKGGQKSIAFQRMGDHLASLSVKSCGFVTLRGAFAASPVSRVQLGLDPGLLMEFSEERALDAEAVYTWLIGTSKDWETHVRATVGEILGGLVLWLELHEPDVCTLIANGDMVDHDIVPPLVGLGGEWKSVFTRVLLGEAGLAALMRPPGQPAPQVDINELFASDSPFALFVRQFGPDESLAQRLIARIQAWDAAVRPSSDGVRIRAYAKDSSYVPSEGEFVVEKQWTRLVLDWQIAS